MEFTDEIEDKTIQKLGRGWARLARSRDDSSCPKMFGVELEDRVFPNVLRKAFKRRDRWLRDDGASILQQLRGRCCYGQCTRKEGTTEILAY
jgi:hypothetical protein